MRLVPPGNIFPLPSSSLILLQRLTKSRLQYRLSIDEESACAIIEKMTTLKLIRPCAAGEEGEAGETEETAYLVIRKAMDAFVKSAGKKMQRIMVRWV